MAALNGACETDERDGKVISFPVASGKTIYRGALCAINPDTGLVEPAADASGFVFVGVAHEPSTRAVLNGMAVAEKNVRVRRYGTHVYTLALASGVTQTAQTMVGQRVYAVDDQTVALTGQSVNHVWVGTIVALDTGNRVRVAVGHAVN